MTNKQDELAENFREVPPPPDVVTYVSRIANRVKSQKDPKLTHYTPTYLSWCARLQFYILMMYPKEKLESELEKAKEAKDSDDKDTIKTAFDSLTAASHKLAEVMYQSQDSDDALLKLRLDRSLLVLVPLG